jgi:hypothetical protein
LREHLARILAGAAARIAPAAEGSDASEAHVLATLDRLARIDAEMHRLRRDGSPGWGNLLADYAAEAARLREAMTLEFRRDERGSMFLVRGESALVHLPGAD